LGASTAAAATAAVLGILALVDATTGETFRAIKDLIGIASVGGPPSLGWVLAAVLIIGGAVIGAWIALTSEGSLLPRSFLAVLMLVGTCGAWTFIWSTIRLGPALATAPFLPFHAALLVVAGLLVPALLVGVPAAAIWARVVERLLEVPAGPVARDP
jgi:hypothetical protein